MKHTPTKTIYIAGPITGLPDANIDAFFNAEKHLYETGAVIAFNPHTNCKDILQSDYENGFGFWAACMRKNMESLKMADAIYLLKGWEGSAGARYELRYAIENNLEIIVSDKF